MSLNQILRQSINMGESLVRIPFQMAKEWMGEDRPNQSGTQHLLHTSITLGENLATIPFQLAREMVQDSRLNENIVVIDENQNYHNPT